MSVPIKPVLSFRGPFRREYSCTLAIEGSWRVGGDPDEASVTDLPILRDRYGVPTVPGTGIRGILRDFCSREIAVLGMQKSVFTTLFGPDPRFSRNAENEEDDRKGRLTVLDAEIKSGKLVTGIRDFCRHDPENGSGANKGKFDAEFACGGELAVSLIYEGDCSEDPELALLDEAVKALTDDRILTIGGKSGWGFGFVTAAECEHKDWDRSGGGREWLATRIPAELNLSSFFSAEEPTVATASAAPDSKRQKFGRTAPQKYRLADLPRGFRPRSWLSIDLKLHFDGPMRVAAPTSPGTTLSKEAEAADSVYIMRNGGSAFLPGSSVRGAFQAAARCIAATLDRSNAQESFADRLFGIVKEGERDSAWRGMVSFGEGVLVNQKMELFDSHNALDRLTGLPADKRLFSDCSLQSPCFRNRILLSWDEADSADLLGAGLFFATLVDFCQGRIWIGANTTRGFGKMKKAVVDKFRTSLIDEDAGSESGISRRQECTTPSASESDSHDALLWWLDIIPASVREKWESVWAKPQ